MIAECCGSLLRLAAVLALGAWLSGTAMAADVAPMPTKAIVPPPVVLSPWTYTATPYGWLIGLKGPLTVKGRTTDVDVSFDDLWNKVVLRSEIPKDLIELMGYFEARNGRVSLFADVGHFKVGLGADLTRSRGVDELNAAVGLSAGLKFNLTIAELAAAYEVAHWGATNVPGSGTAIDVYGGVRAWWQSANASLAASGTVNIGDLTRNANGTFSASANVTWVDPLVGVRLRNQLAPNVNLIVRGDVGGFGAGSKFSWFASAVVNYDFYIHNNVTWSGMVGYQALNADYSQGAGNNQYVWNVTIYGPILGITARF
jgi:hypothetical protein